MLLVRNNLVIQRRHAPVQAHYTTLTCHVLSLAAFVTDCILWPPTKLAIDGHTIKSICSNRAIIVPYRAPFALNASSGPGRAYREAAFPKSKRPLNVRAGIMSAGSTIRIIINGLRSQSPGCRPKR